MKKKNPPPKKKAPDKAAKKASAPRRAPIKNPKKAHKKVAKKPPRKPKKAPKKARNASLIEAAFPVAQMQAIGKAAVDDLTRLRRPTVEIRRAAGGRGRGTRKNPIIHRIVPRSSR